MSDNSMQALTDSINKIGRNFEAFKTTNDERLKSLESGEDSKTAETHQQLVKIEGDLKKMLDAKRAIEIEIKTDRERIEELEARAKQPGFSAAEKRSKKYSELFLNWMRTKGQDPVIAQQLDAQQREMIEAKDVTIGTPGGGGYGVPEEISRMIEKQELLFSPVRSDVKVVQVGTGDYKELVDLRGFAGGWIGETGDRSTPTATPTLREIAPTFGELYCYPQATEWSLDDIFFNVEQWLADSAADAFAVAEATSVLTGNGSSQMTGMLNTTPTLIADFGSPLRASAVYQYLTSADTASPPVAQIFSDSLITLIYSLNSRYRAGAKFIMNSNTIAAVRKLKDTNGQYHWQPGLQAGQPDRLLGYPVSTWEQMDDIAINAFPIAFGNFQRGYVLADRVGLRITRDQVTKVGYVRFYMRRREGGFPLNNNAIKFLRTI